MLIENYITFRSIFENFRCPNILQKDTQQNGTMTFDVLKNQDNSVDYNSTDDCSARLGLVELQISLKMLIQNSITFCGIL